MTLSCRATRLDKLLHDRIPNVSLHLANRAAAGPWPGLYLSCTICLAFHFVESARTLAEGLICIFDCMVSLHFNSKGQPTFWVCGRPLSKLEDQLAFELYDCFAL